LTTCHYCQAKCNQLQIARQGLACRRAARPSGICKREPRFIVNRIGGLDRLAPAQPVSCSNYGYVAVDQLAAKLRERLRYAAARQREPAHAWCAATGGPVFKLFEIFAPTGTPAKENGPYYI
jgi:hypothetical protein